MSCAYNPPAVGIPTRAQRASPSASRRPPSPRRQAPPVRCCPPHRLQQPRHLPELPPLQTRPLPSSRPSVHGGAGTPPARSETCLRAPHSPAPPMRSPPPCCPHWLQQAHPRHPRPPPSLAPLPPGAATPSTYSRSIASQSNLLAILSPPSHAKAPTLNTSGLLLSVFLGGLFCRTLRYSL